MIKSKKFNLYMPDSEHAMNVATEEMNSFFKDRPACKIINIEHVFSPEGSSFRSFCFLCVWYLEPEN